MGRLILYETRSGSATAGLTPAEDMTMESQPLIHFDYSWPEPEKAAMRAAVEAIEPLAGASIDARSALGAPWIATRHTLDEITLYMAHRMNLGTVLIAQSIDDLIAKIQGVEGARTTRPLFQLIYESTAARSITSDDLQAILDTSRAKNQTLDITGLLLFKDNRFMQVLEGSEDAVRSLYATIRADNRHTDVETLLTAPVRQRAFPDWAMSLEDLTALPDSSSEGLSDYFQDGSLSIEHEPLTDVLLALRRFRSG